MFNISFSELLVILLLAFLIIGPKDMSKVARFLGRSVKKGQQFLGDMKSYVNDATSDSGIQDIKKEIDDVKNEAAKINPLHDFKEEIKKEQESLTEIKKELQPLSPMTKQPKGFKK